MDDPLSPAIRNLVPLLDLLTFAAEQSAHAARKVYRVARRQRRGATLRPGPHTPLWNELVKEARTHLGRYGEKAKLARILGVPRQRVHQYLRAKSAGPDAERTLRLLIWVHARRSGRDPA